MLPEEYGALEEFLYEAIFQPEGAPALPREIVGEPELQIYYERFGAKDGDHARCAVCDGRMVGAIWCRCMKGFGHVADDVPELAMAVKAPYRHRGIGKQLLHEMLADLRKFGYKEVSLSVQKINFAYKIYQAAGFHVLRETEEEYIMAREL